MHWPVAFRPGDELLPRKVVDGEKVLDMVDIDYVDTWRAMEGLLASGKAKAIGVSNFNIRKLDRLLRNANVAPAVNQVEMSPYLAQVSYKPNHPLLASHFCFYAANTSGSS